MRLSDGGRADDPLGRLADAWDAEEQRSRETRVLKAIATPIPNSQRAVPYHHMNPAEVARQGSR